MCDVQHGRTLNLELRDSEPRNTRNPKERMEEKMANDAKTGARPLRVSVLPLLRLLLVNHSAAGIRSVKLEVPVVRVLVWGCLLLALVCSAADSPETRAFNAGRDAFQDGLDSRAEMAFSNFVARYPQSPQLPQALLYEARAALAGRRFQAASDILSTNSARAGALIDQFQYWMARVPLESGDLGRAAQALAGFTRQFTNSPLRLDAAVAEAEAEFGLKRWTSVVELIESPNGAFHAAAAASGASDRLISRGYLLLAEAYLRQRQFAEAERALSRINVDAADTRLRWERQLLLCRIQFEAGRQPEALAGTTNLLAISSGDPRWRAAAVALQGDILAALDRSGAAIKAFELNLAPDVPVERRREAFARTVELALQENQISNAVARLESFITEHPGESGSDVALLTIGELRLKQHSLGANAISSTNLLPATNLLESALESFNRLIRDFPNSPFAAKAQLDRGWAFLAQGRQADAAGAFQAAADALPPSEAQAVAIFKLADVQFAAGNITNAISNYRRLLHDFAGFPRVQRELGDRARFQTLQAASMIKDMAAATEAMEKIASDYPSSSYAEQSLLLYAQMLNELSSPAAARKVCAEFIDSFPRSPLLPEAQLAVARTYEQEQNWAAAAAEYARWTARFPTNSELCRAEFSRAVALDHAGQQTNALQLFTNFVARFTTNALAARAQMWVGNYYLNRGVLNKGEASDLDLREAERNYQLIFQPGISSNWPVTELTYRAQVNAGRAAFLRQSWVQAAGYFTNLLNTVQRTPDPRCPPTVVAEAVFAWGDTYMQATSTNEVERFRQALNIFSYIPQTWPNGPIAPLAWGRIANCYWSIAGLLAVSDQQASATAYEQAYQNYQKVTNSAVGDMSALAKAEIGMADVRRRQADLLRRQTDAASRARATDLEAEALTHYTNVIYPAGEEQPDPFWVEKAGVYAAQLCESQKKWELAINLYTRVGEMIPSLRDSMARRASAAREQQASQKQ